MAESDPELSRQAATEAANREVFSTSRDALGVFVFIGDILLAAGIPIALRHHGPHELLIGWGIAIAITSYLWELFQRVAPEMTRDNARLRDRWGWVSTIAWASLPWLVFESLDVGFVAWVLVFVVVHAIATDLLFLSQTDAPSLDFMVITYVGSFFIAMAIGGHVIPLGAVLAAGAVFVTASKAWSEVSRELIQKRIESDERVRTDELTGLATRAAALEAIERLVAEGAEEIHCAFLDVDDFKHLNDNHGYAAGDRVLRAIGENLRDALPATWTIARFGGDEFVAVGPDRHDFSAIVEADIRSDDGLALDIAQTLSVGVTSMPASSAEGNVLFREAGAALRLAKRLGKNQVLEISDELRALESAKGDLARRVGGALDNDHIVPFAQRIIDLETGETVGMELLARWPQLDGSMIPPNEFIPVIEDQGRGPVLGMRMITHAVEALAQPALRNRSTFITVNVSARHLYHRRLPAEILSLLGHHSVAPERLVLEITESQHLPSSPIWQQTAHQLRTLGIGLAMDDFGSGYSTMAQLIQVPFTHVKVDQVISQSIDRPGGHELAAGIAAMAGGAGMEVIVEAIETETQAAAMIDAGYRLGQGYLFHRPEALADVIAALQSPPPQPPVLPADQADQSS